MEKGTGIVGPGTPAGPDRTPPEALRAALQTLRAENAALVERNRVLERREPEAVVEGLRIQVASLTGHNERLEHLLRELRRALFARKSEKLHRDQLQLAFEAFEGAIAEAQAPASTSRPSRATHARSG